MKTVITTVKEANVKIDGNIIGQINNGMLILVGFTQGDNIEIVSKMVDKILSLRIFPDENGQINLSLSDVNGDILSVSQFTLYANAKKGRRPSFVDALVQSEATLLYDEFNKQLSNKYKSIQKGVFGADMDVFSINQGPFTLVLDSKELF